MTDQFTPSEENLRRWVNEIINAAIDGDFKAVKHYAKKIRQQAVEDKKQITN